MARPIPSFLNHVPFSSASLMASIAALSILALVVFLCTSSRKSNRFQQPRKLVSKINSNISCRAVSLAKMVSWRKVDAAEEEEEERGGGGGCGSSVDDDDDDEVWRKRIMRGERCRPLEFSGKIDYDSDIGNLL